MEELDKLKRAQMYMEQLAQGINPLTGEEVPGDSVLYSAVRGAPGGRRARLWPGVPPVSGANACILPIHPL